MISFVVPGDPVPWERAGSDGRKRFTAKRTERWERTVRDAALLAGARPIAAPVRLEIIAYRATRQRCDWDNLGKAISDALNGVAFLDDCQVEDARVVKRLDPERPRVEVLVEAIDGFWEAPKPRKPGAPRRARALELPMAPVVQTPEGLRALLPADARARVLRAKGRLTSSTRRFAP